MTAPLPANPVEVIIEATMEPEAIAVVNDEEISATVASAESLQTTGMESASKAGEYFVAQTVSEGAADQSYAGAETAASEEVYNAHTGQAETFIAQADGYNTLGHSTAAMSEEANAKSTALGRVAVVQIAAQEIAEREVISTKEVADRTQAGVEQEIKAVMAGAEEDAATAQNLEASLKEIADPAALKV